MGARRGNLAAPPGPNLQDHWMTKEYVMIAPYAELSQRLRERGRPPLRTHSYFDIRSRETTFESIGAALVLDWVSW